MAFVRIVADGAPGYLFEMPGASQEEAGKIAEKWVTDTAQNIRREVQISTCEQRPKNGYFAKWRTPSTVEIALARAENVNPGNLFVASCRAYFQDHGCVTPAQLAALNKMEDRTPRERDDDGVQYKPKDYAYTGRYAKLYANQRGGRYEADLAAAERAIDRDDPTDWFDG